MGHESISWLTALGRGFRRRCPQCGRGKLLRGYLMPEEKCTLCALDFQTLKTDDGPAYVTMGLVCVFIVPFFFVVQALYDPPPWMALLISLPLTAFIILSLLPSIKGAFMAAHWKSQAL